MVSKILDKDEKIELVSIGGSDYICVPSGWKKMLNMHKSKKVVVALIDSKNGIFLGAWNKNNKKREEVLE